MFGEFLWRAYIRARVEYGQKGIDSKGSTGLDRAENKAKKRNGLAGPYSAGMGYAGKPRIDHGAIKAEVLDGTWHVEARGMSQIWRVVS